MPTRVNAIGRYGDIAPELQDTLRRNGMQAHIIREGDELRLAVQGHDSPLLVYPITKENLAALTDGGTNYSNRTAYNTFAAIIAKDFHLPKDYIHARNANGRVIMGLHGYRIGVGEYGRLGNPYMNLRARHGILGWTPRNQAGFHLRRIGGAPIVADRPDGRIKPGELSNGAYGFYYKGAQTGTAGSRTAAEPAGEDVLMQLGEIVPEIQARPRSNSPVIPYSEAITSEVYFSADRWNDVLSSHGIIIDKDGRTLTVKSNAINRDFVYDLSEEEVIELTADSVKEIPVQRRIDIINGIITNDYVGKVTMEMLEGKEAIGLALTPEALKEIRDQERSLYEQLRPAGEIVSDFHESTVQDLFLQEQDDERRGIGHVNGETLYDRQQGWFREGAHGREVSVGDIRVEPVNDEQENRGQDVKYRMTAVINGEAISHEITRRQYDKFMAVDDYHRMKLFSKIFKEVDMKDLPRERNGIHMGAAILAALTVAGEFTRGPRMAPDIYMERHAAGRVYMKPGVDSPRDIASRAFEAGINAAEHGVGLGR